MMLRYSFLLVVLATWLWPTPLHAQTDTESDGAYCNLFYINSSDLDKLPLEDVCFVADEYSLSNPQKMRCIGPIEGPIDLFRSYPWSMQFSLPEIKEGERLEIILPKELAPGPMEMKPGEFALTISDNSKFDRYVDVVDQVSFVAVSGWGRLTSFIPKSGNMRFPEYEVQMDLRVKEVEELEGKLTPVGTEFRLRMVLRVEALD